MISEQTLLKIAGQLLQKTRASQVRWLPDMFHEYGCVVRLRHSRVRVFGTDPRDDGSQSRGLTVENEYGTIIGEITRPVDTPEGRVLDELIQVAIGTSQHQESALNELEEVLQGPGVIGGG
ncbi:MAG: hypothetical protein J2P46_21675 [Zavarzinella sp.]|nr:hypothetical protein [Zavarzinella sp.]